MVISIFSSLYSSNFFYFFEKKLFLLHSFVCYSITQGHPSSLQGILSWTPRHRSWYFTYQKIQVLRKNIFRYYSINMHPSCSSCAEDITILLITQCQLQGFTLNHTCKSTHKASRVKTLLSAAVWISQLAEILHWNSFSNSGLSWLEKAGEHSQELFCLSSRRHGRDPDEQS